MEVICGFNVMDKPIHKSIDNTKGPLKGPLSLSQATSKGLQKCE
jgi:hypothetical protein